MYYGFNPGDIERVFGKELRPSNATYLAGYFTDVAVSLRRKGEHSWADYATKQAQHYRRLAKKWS